MAKSNNSPVLQPISNTFNPFTKRLLSTSIISFDLDFSNNVVDHLSPASPLAYKVAASTSGITFWTKPDLQFLHLHSSGRNINEIFWSEKCIGDE